MSKIELWEYGDDRRDLWDEVVNHSKNGTFIHLRDFIGYHAHRFDDRSVIVLKDGRPVAVFPCNLDADKIVSHAGLTYAGLIYGHDLRAADILDVFAALGEHYRQLGVKSVCYKPTPHIFHRYPAEEDLYALFRMGARVYRRDISSVLSLQNRQPFSSSRRCSIRKARKFGLVIREGDFFEDYHRLLSEVVAKFGVTPVHSVDELRLLHSLLPDRIRLFGVFENDLLLAGALMFDCHHVVHTQYLASCARGRDVGALDHLLAHLIEVVFSDRRYFSFGISTEEDGRYLNEGLIFQKEGFGARGVVCDCYSWSLGQATSALGLGSLFCVHLSGWLSIVSSSVGVC